MPDRLFLRVGWNQGKIKLLEMNLPVIFSHC